MSTPTPEILPTVHRLKAWMEFTPALDDGSKPFEARKDDRAFRVGDILELVGWDRDRQCETGWSQRRTVTYKLSGPAWGVESGHCILGLSPLAHPLSPAEAERIREALESLLLNYQQGHAACPDHQPDICMACRGREAIALLEKAAGGQ